MSPDERTTLIARYADGPAEVERSLQGFKPGGLTAHPLAGKWSAAEIVHHLADSESISAIRLRRLLVEDLPVIWGYDQEAFAADLAYNERDLAPALAVFKGVRATTTQLLERMTEAQWSRKGWHTEHGVYTPETWLKIYAAHAHNHAAQIARLKETLG